MTIERTEVSSISQQSERAWPTISARIDAVSSRRKRKGATGKKRTKKRTRPYHLESSKVFLPPNELLVLGTHGGHHVVKVHDNVDEGVEQTEKGGVATGSEADSEPDTHRHNTVVDDVKKGDVLVLFAQNEEELQTNKTRLDIRAN